MKYADFYTAFGEAVETADHEVFLAEHSSCCWLSGNIEENIIKICDIIYTAANGNFKSLLDVCEINQVTVSRKYVIPYRSVQNWCSLKRKAPDYLLMLIAYVESCERSLPRGEGALIKAI